MADVPLVPRLLLPLLLGCAGPEEGEVVDLVRLTATQWENATADLLGLPEPPGLSAGFVPDPAAGRFDTNAAELQVTPVLQQQLLAASAELARETVADEDRYIWLVRAHGASAAATPEAWLSSFGRRAFRRSLTPEEREVYRNLFLAAPEVFPHAESFPAGVQLSILGFLQSPHFLYRVERARPGSNELEPISFASKLAFSLWNAPPDDALLAVAEQAASAEDLLAELPRLIEDDRAVAMILDLHRQVLHTETYANIPREFVSYEDYETTLNAAMQAEVDAFVEEIVLSGGTVADLLTSRQTWADSQIAAIYGIEGVEGQGVAGLEPVSLDPAERAGLLTLSGFLAVHSSEQSENLIRRSAFVHESMFCTSLPPPPPDATGLPPREFEQTARERIEEHTATCGGAATRP